MAEDDPFDLHKSLSQFDAQWDDLINTTRKESSEVEKNPTKVVSSSEGKIGSIGSHPNGATKITSRVDEEEEEDESEEEDDDEVQEKVDTAREQKKETISSLGKKLSVLVGQLEDLRYKYKKSLNQNEKLDGLNKELMSQIDSLEDENTDLQTALKEKVEDAKRNKLIGGGAGVDRKRGQRNNAQKQANKDQGFNLALISDGEVDDNVVDIGIGGQTKSVIEKYSQRLFDYVPFKRDIQEVRSTFGGATASYFAFFRWMLFNFVIMGLCALLFASIHIVRMMVRGNTSGVFVGDSILPGFMNYSSFSTGESFTYTINVIIGLGLLLFMCSHKIIMEDRQMKRMDVIEQQNNYTFSKDVLCRWDNFQAREQEAQHAFGLIGLSFREKIAESKKLGKITSRSQLETFILYSKRVVVFLLYCCIQVASYATIIWLTIQSASIQDYFSNVPGLRSLTNFIVPAAVTSINAMTPAMYKFLTKFEQWDSGQFALNMLISRMYLSNIMNLLILALSYGLLADPFLLSSSDNSERRSQLENVFDDAIFSCRLNAAAEGLFTLVISEFFINGIIFLGVGAVPVMINRYIMPFKKFEMNIAQRMVALLYFISLMMLAFPFSPLVVIIMPFMLAARLKWEKTLTLKYYGKPKDVWLAHKSGAFFVMFYMITLTLVALPAMLLFMSQHTFAKNCDIQDNFVNLCAGEVSAVNNTCTLDTTSVYYDYFSDSSNCPEGYPACVCMYSCGPFVNHPNAFQSAREVMYTFNTLKFIWRRCVAPSYFSWWLVGFFYVYTRLRKNTLVVTEATYTEAERAYETQIHTLENEKKQHTKLINRLKLLEK